MNPIFILLLLLLLPAFAAALIWLTIGLKCSLKWRRKGMNLPPGNMGWPLSIWENISFLKSSPCNSHGDFAERNIQRYGKTYKSHIMGEPTIFSADVDFQRFVLLNDGKLFEQHGPKTLSHILGRTSMLVINGEMHHYLKSLSLSFVDIAKLKTLFVSDIDRIVRQIMKDWKENTPFPIKEEACKVTFNVMVKNVLSMNPGVEEAEELRKLYMSFMKGLLALPVYFPGAAYWKAIQVISESLRLGNIIKMVRKKASKDVHFKGYDIPSGWSVILLLVSAHMDSSVHENPEKFDPWRWKINHQSTAYMPFGQGLRKCPGQELARMETAIFLHHLLLNFEWELVESDHPVGYAIPQFLKGLPLKVHRRRPFSKR